VPESALTPLVSELMLTSIIYNQVNMKSRFLYIILAIMLVILISPYIR
jgi:hypothetical protein